MLIFPLNAFPVSGSARARARGDTSALRDPSHAPRQRAQWVINGLGSRRTAVRVARSRLHNSLRFARAVEGWVSLGRTSEFLTAADQPPGPALPASGIAPTFVALASASSPFVSRRRKSEVIATHAQ